MDYIVIELNKLLTSNISTAIIVTNSGNSGTLFNPNNTNNLIKDAVNSNMDSNFINLDTGILTIEEAVAKNLSNISVGYSSAVKEIIVESTTEYTFEVLGAKIEGNNII